MPILWPFGNPYGWYPLLTTTFVLVVICAIIDKDSRENLKALLLYTKKFFGFIRPPLIFVPKNTQQITSNTISNKEISPTPTPSPKNTSQKLDSQKQPSIDYDSSFSSITRTDSTSPKISPINIKVQIHDYSKLSFNDIPSFSLPKSSQDSNETTTSPQILIKSIVPPIDQASLSSEVLYENNSALTASTTNSSKSSSEAPKREKKPKYLNKDSLKIKSKKKEKIQVNIAQNSMDKEKDDATSPQKSKVNIKFFKYDPSVENTSNTIPAENNNQYDNKNTVILNEGESAGKNTLFVCTKCQRTDVNKCELGYYSCVLEPDYDQTNKSNIGDIEDLITPMVANSTIDGKNKRTGRILYENLSNLLKQQERINKLCTVSGIKPRNSLSPYVSSENPCSNSLDNRLQILPVKCLGTCSRGNVIAFGAQNKFSYQFCDLNEVDNEHLEDILEFASMYTESEDGFSKTKTRPNHLRSNLLARIPPLNNNFINLEL
ncbi:hypothetical protein AYI70_g1690 [Smittium culicis]|uniref:Uncharacterized protein n=1 Tax=Smittium culicis TaxID=133412 RepID=A0A1R1YCB1_9FUNG|nr:hypothetical protein AYI70_g1690 [Smittium culicis]